jgi:hypothetical protein
MTSRISALKLRLEALWDAKEDSKRVEIPFRAPYRLLNRSPGRPKYPRFSWDYLGYFLENFEDI